ncbi:MAG TPA: hydrogenase maturation protease [Chloroflexota bacterium]|nr:hydrogenase maturation protease [Chloroflexota bacterium]
MRGAAQREGEAAVVRVLVAGVGYTNLRDMSVGPALAERLGAETWPEGVDVVDLGIGAIAAVHYMVWAQENGAYERAVLFGAARRGRPPGSLTCYRWDGVLPGAEDVQAQVADAVTGAISLAALLIVGRQLGALPADVVVVEVEPADESWGPGFSQEVAACLDAAAAAIRRAARASGADLPVLGVQVPRAARPRRAGERGGAGPALGR